jgi:hypothetical protein
MKKLVCLFVVAVFAVTAGMAMAQGKVDTAGKSGAGEAALGQAATTVNCCVKGECKQLGSEADCAKAGGKVVKDCKDCSK